MNKKENQLKKLSVVIPARDEEGCIVATVEHLSQTLKTNNIAYEIVVVNDGSIDSTWNILLHLKEKIPELVPIQNSPPHGFGCAVRRGLKVMTGDAVVIMMADGSDDCYDVIHYWNTLQKGYECAFGSRFIEGGKVIGYPLLKYVLNRMANHFIRLLFRIKLNDTTNAFKAYRKNVIDGCSPLLSLHFNLTVELPLKAIVRGYSWTVIPVTWRNRKSGIAKFKIKEMGSRYFFIISYIWLEKYFSKGDYKKPDA